MDIVARATIMFFLLFAMLRFLGRRELAEITPFEMILMIVLGDLIQQAVTQDDFSVTGASLAIATIAFWALALSWLTFLSPKAEELLEGKPLVIVCDGELLAKNLSAHRLSKLELESEMRLAGIASLRQVAWGILEPQGKISFIRKEGDPGEPGR